MNLKKALVGCILALSLVLGVLFVSNGKGIFHAEGENFPPINAKKPHSIFKVADGENFPPINGGKTNTIIKVIADGENFPPINGGKKGTTIKVMNGQDLSSINT